MERDPRVKSVQGKRIMTTSMYGTEEKWETEIIMEHEGIYSFSVALSLLADEVPDLHKVKEGYRRVMIHGILTKDTFTFIAEDIRESMK